MAADRVHGRSAPDPAENPGLKLPSMGSPCVRSAAKTALVQLIDGQIAARHAEIDELVRIRRAVLGNDRMSKG